MSKAFLFNLKSFSKFQLIVAVDWLADPDDRQDFALSHSFEFVRILKYLFYPSSPS